MVNLFDKTSNAHSVPDSFSSANRGSKFSRSGKGFMSDENEDLNQDSSNFLSLLNLAIYGETAEVREKATEILARLDAAENPEER